MVSSGIEPESRASETLILSIVLRDQIETGAMMRRKNRGTFLQSKYSNKIAAYFAFTFNVTSTLLLIVEKLPPTLKSFRLIENFPSNTYIPFTFFTV